MAYIRDQYDLVIGSEGGNDFAASDIAFAHGIELQSFSWMDEEMKSNQGSEYYMGKYFNPSGGVAERFAKRIPVKDEYQQLFLEAKYDLPLYSLVYNDSIITTYHWDWSTIKIKGAEQNRMLRELLYNVPPLYHLDQEMWDTYQNSITEHVTVWSKFSKEAVKEEMTDFTYLSENGDVQLCVYGDELFAAANFGDGDFVYMDEIIPPHSVLISMGGEMMIYTPEVIE